MGINYSSHAMDIIKLLSECDSSFFKQVKQDHQFSMIPDTISTSELFSDTGISIPLQHTTEQGIEIDHFIAIAIDLDIKRSLAIMLVANSTFGDLKPHKPSTMLSNIYPPNSPLSKVVAITLPTQ